MVAILLLPFSALGIAISTCVTRPWLTDQRPWLTDQSQESLCHVLPRIRSIFVSPTAKKNAAKAISHRLPKIVHPPPPRLKLGSSDLNQGDPFKPWNQSSINKYGHMYGQIPTINNFKTSCMDFFARLRVTGDIGPYRNISIDTNARRSEMEP